jgi:hypothetical protein
MLRGSFAPPQTLARSSLAYASAEEDEWGLPRAPEGLPGDYGWHGQSYERRPSAPGFYPSRSVAPTAVVSPPMAPSSWWTSPVASATLSGGYNPEAAGFAEPGGGYYGADLNRQRSPGSASLFSEPMPGGTALLPPVAPSTSIWSTDPMLEPDLSWAADLEDEDASLAARPQSHWSW